MKELKVLHLLWTAQMGGIERLVLNLCAEQTNNSTLKIGIYIAKNDGFLSEEFTNSKIKIHYGNIKSGFSFSLNKLKETIKIFSEYDIIHFHFFNPLLAYAALKCNKKIIYTEHGNFGFGQEKKFSKNILYSIQKYFLNHKVDYITFNSSFTEKTALEKYGLSGIKKSVVYNGIPNLTINFENNFNTNNSDKFIIGTIARLAIVKRIDRLITAMSILNNSSIYLEIIGDGPLKQQLTDQAIQSNCIDQISFLGFDKNPALRMKNWSVCVFPSSGEAFGLVLIEAYQFGLPVIVFSDGGGLVELTKMVDPELIVDNETELAKLITVIHTNPSLYCNPERSNLRKQLAMTFGISSMEKKLSEIYHHI